MRKSAVAITFLGLAAVAGIVVLELRSEAPKPVAAPVALSDVPFVDETGATSLGAYRGTWNVVLFGYMTCPDVCPTTLAYLARELKQLGDRANGVRVLFVSVDPQRDGPLALGKYVRHFDKRFIGMTADDDALRAFSTPLGAYFSRDEAKDSAAGYLVTHSSALFLFDPQARFVKALSAPHERGALAQELTRLVGNGAH